MTGRRLALGCAMGIALVAGCNNPSTGTDSGTPGTDSGGMTGLPVVSIGSSAMPMAADLSCLGMRTAPTPGDAAMVTVTVHDFQFSANAIANAQVNLFPDNLVADGCTGSCVAAMTDASGSLSAMLPQGGWFAYRIAAGATSGSSTTVLTVAYNRTAPMAGGTIDLPSVSQSTVGVIPTLFMRTRVAGRGIVSGSVFDCAGEEIRGAQVHMFQGDTEIMGGSGSMDTFFGYFNGSRIPAPMATYTNYDGIFAGANVNVPDDGSPIRVELRGVIEEGGDPVLLACEEIEIFADAVSIISVGPLRNDYAADHGCNGRD
jgi:hypothetical protein